MVKDTVGEEGDGGRKARAEGASSAEVRAAKARLRDNAQRETDDSQQQLDDSQRRGIDVRVAYAFQVITRRQPAMAAIA